MTRVKMQALEEEGATGEVWVRDTADPSGGAYAAVGGGVSDGDKGDITVSGGGATWAIDPAAVTLAKMADIATDRLIGRDTAGTGVPEALTVGGGVEFSGAGGIQRSALTGDVTASAGSNTTVIANDAVTYAKMQNVSATQRALGRNSGGAGDAEEVTASQLLDWIGSTRGAVLYRGASGWAVLAPGTSGDVLTSNGAGADPAYAAAGAGDVTKAVKTAAQTGIGTSYTDVSSLGISVVSGSWYEFTALIMAQSSGTTIGVDVAVNGPAATAVYYRQDYWTSATAMTERSATAYDNNTASTAGPGAGYRVFQVRGVVLPSANGTLIPRIKAETGGTCDVAAGSAFVVRKLS